MGKSLLTKLTLGLIAALALAGTIQAADEKAPSLADATKEKKPTRVPFTGKLSAVDKTAMTVTIAGKEKSRTISITSQTRIQKAGKPATLGDGVVGEEAAGQAIRTADGKEEAVSLRFGPKPEAAPKKEPKVKKSGEEKKDGPKEPK